MLIDDKCCGKIDQEVQRNVRQQRVRCQIEQHKHQSHNACADDPQQALIAMEQSEQHSCRDGNHGDGQPREDAAQQVHQAAPEYDLLPYARRDRAEEPLYLLFPGTGRDQRRHSLFSTLLTSFLFCFIGYFNGTGSTLFVMLQGIIGAFGVRLPVSWFVSHQAWATLFHIGLATPASSLVQIILCGIYFTCMLQRQSRVKSA